MTYSESDLHGGQNPQRSGGVEERKNEMKIIFSYGLRGRVVGRGEDDARARLVGSQERGKVR